MPQAVPIGRHTLHCGDCLEVLAELPPGVGRRRRHLAAVQSRSRLSRVPATGGRRRSIWTGWSRSPARCAGAEAGRLVLPQHRRVLRPALAAVRADRAAAADLRAAEPHRLGEVDRAPGDSVGHYKPLPRRALPPPHARAHLPPDAARATWGWTGWRSGCRSRTSPTSPAAATPPDRRCRGNTWFIPYPTGAAARRRNSTIRAPSRSTCRAGASACMGRRTRWCWTRSSAPAPRCSRPELEGARGIGIEIDPSYVAIARERLARAAVRPRP